MCDSVNGAIDIKYPSYGVARINGHLTTGARVGETPVDDHSLVRIGCCNSRMGSCGGGTILNVDITKVLCLSQVRVWVAASRHELLSVRKSLTVLPCRQKSGGWIRTVDKIKLM